MAALGPSLVTIIVVLGLTGWERYTRVVRAEVMAQREKEFIEAARAIGVGRLRIIFRHHGRLDQTSGPRAGGKLKMFAGSCCRSWSRRRRRTMPSAYGAPSSS